MVALQIRQVPDSTRDMLAEQAAARGQSLQAYLLEIVVGAARRGDNLALLRRFDTRTDGSTLDPADAVADLERGRAQRAGDLDTPVPSRLST